MRKGNWISARESDPETGVRLEVDLVGHGDDGQIAAEK
jgi:hypothetical protein